MAMNNTQCPHCFTTYAISDEQYRVSQGMVRCGTCQERFQARFLIGDDSKPRFDPRKAFIEPFTADENKRQEAERDDESNPKEDIQLSNFDDGISNSINSDLSLDIDDDAPITTVDSSKLSAEEMLANIRAKHAREKAEGRQQEINLANNDIMGVAESSLQNTDYIPGTYQYKNKPDNNGSRPDSKSQNHLIDEVDSLVKKKLLKDQDSDTDQDTDNNEYKSWSQTTVKKNKDPISAYTEDDFELSSARPKKSLWSRLLALPLLLIIIVLVAALVYQLWMKQIISFEQKPEIQEHITQLSSKAADELEKYNISIPVRRNLSRLELVSARTFAHPTRSSTVLLKVDILNLANFAQPLPWLEMTLTDADGALVSLRNLSPKDYIYKNNTSAQINARELKKVTIELLSFPKQATGYELKLLNR